MEDLGCAAVFLLIVLVMFSPFIIAGCIVADVANMPLETQEMVIINKIYEPPKEVLNKKTDKMEPVEAVYRLTFKFNEKESVSGSVTESTYKSVALGDSLRVNYHMGRFSEQPYVTGVQEVDEIDE